MTRSRSCDDISGRPREDRPRPRHAAELREDGAGDRRRARALRRRRVGDRPHGPALRPGDVGGLLRGARRPRARSHARRGLRQPRRADGARADPARARAPRGAPRRRPRARRRELDARRGAVRGAPRAADRPRRVRVAQLRPHDARGDQPRGRRPPLGTALPALAGGRGQPAGRGRARGSLPVRRQHDDRHPGRARGALPGQARGAGGRDAARRVSARHAAPPGARRRPAARRGDRGPRHGRARDAGPASRSTRARARCSAPTGPGAVTLTDPVGYLDFLSLEADAAAVLTDSGGHPGGDHVPRGPLLHPARQHRAAGDRAGRHQHPARPGPGAHRGDPGAARGGSGGAPATTGEVGWSCGAQRVAEVLADW